LRARCEFIVAGVPPKGASPARQNKKPAHRGLRRRRLADTAADRGGGEPELPPKISPVGEIHQWLSSSGRSLGFGTIRQYAMHRAQPGAVRDCRRHSFCVRIIAMPPESRPTARRVRFATGYLALDMLQAATDELAQIPAEHDALPEVISGASRWVRGLGLGVR
jgi:hypothetical protein